MRLRNVPNAYEKLKACSNFVPEPRDYKGKWKKYFDNDNPVHIEIGPGKGEFIVQLSQQNPHINYIAIEKSPAVLVKIIRKIPDEGIHNLAITVFDAGNLEEIFESGEVEKLYLNFSDPWPKKKHAKRRLTSPKFLKIYKNILKPGSIIEFKTDNRPMFDYSIETFKEEGYNLIKITYDLYNSDLLEGNIPTEYEKKFHSLGTPINKLIAVYEADNAATEERKDDIHPQE
ncbi:MAG: tRNA (guanosine(46)-N7)-methyltransferase TrmB [Clostridiaceae bacterium]|nr:tRNA (guanosine(46)-N7)-methyltransferase TrmB [Clostridiaceae bacterium]